MIAMADRGAQRSADLGWEHFAHDADIGIRGRGRTIGQAFEQAALALTAIVTDAEIVAGTMVQVSCRRANLELLLVDWLDAVIYEMSVRRMLFGRFSVDIDGTVLAGRLWGEPVNIERHAPACEPKGATLTALKVECDTAGIWSAGCVIDV